jgi:hypothetical protein
MSRILYDQKITNTIDYKNKSNKKETDDYHKVYTKEKRFFGICFHKHRFEEDVNTNGNIEPKAVGFKNGD